MIIKHSLHLCKKFRCRHMLRYIVFIKSIQDDSIVFPPSSLRFSDKDTAILCVNRNMVIRFEIEVTLCDIDHLWVQFYGVYHC